MANKLYAMEQLTEEVAKDVAASPQEWMRFLNLSLIHILFIWLHHMPTEVVMPFTEQMLQERLWQKNSIIIV